MILQTFIVFEGLDGTGTSTQIKLLQERLDEKNSFITAEPTDKETGLFLRKMLKGEIAVTPKTAAYMFAADRCEHVYGQNGIVENCEKGKIVISDRYFFSSLAYQSFDCGETLPYELNKNFPLPKYLFFFEIEPEKSLERVIKRSKQTGEQVEIYEKIEIQKKTYEAYQKVMTFYSKEEFSQMKIIRIDASLSIDEIHKKIWSIVQEMPILKS